MSPAATLPPWMWLTSPRPTSPLPVDSVIGCVETSLHVRGWSGMQLYFRRCYECAVLRAFCQMLEGCSIVHLRDEECAALARPPKAAQGFLTILVFTRLEPSEVTCAVDVTPASPTLTYPGPQYQAGTLPRWPWIVSGNVRGIRESVWSKSPVTPLRPWPTSGT